MSDATRNSTDRLGLEILSPDDCWELLGVAPVGRVAFVDAGEPLVLPVTYSLQGHSVVFRSGTGTKLEAAAMNRPLAFEIDDWDDTYRTGWSVLARGMGETVYDDDEIASFAGSEPWLDSAAEGTWVRIRVDEVSGRRIAR